MKLTDQLNAEIALTVAWLEDTLQPALDILSLKAIVNDMLADVELFESKKGISEHTKKSKERINLMLEKIERLDKIAMQNNTFQLITKHTQLKSWNLEQEIIRLNNELLAKQKAWEEL